MRWDFDPMCHEATLQPVAKEKILLPQEKEHDVDEQEDGLTTNLSSLTTEGESEEQLRNFLNNIAKKVPTPILKTSKQKKSKPLAVEEGDTITVRRSGRIVDKVKKGGGKNVEELAQQVLAKKMGALSPTGKMTKEAMERYVKMYGKTLPMQAMAAMESLLKAVGDTNEKGKKVK
uniref:Uncharacterized protein n=1 Tax=Arundo donax TaxID=35708 RepID=A0A0A9D4I4_ARUDO